LLLPELGAFSFVVSEANNENKRNFYLEMSGPKKSTRASFRKVDQIKTYFWKIKCTTTDVTESHADSRTNAINFPAIVKETRTRRPILF
jgi:hypothetical protein